MARKIRFFIAAALLGSVFTIATEAGQVRAALSYPSAFSYFPKCDSASDEFCVETLEFTPDGGSTQVIAEPVNGTPSSVPYVNVFISGTYTGPSGTPGAGGLFPSLSVNYYAAGSFRADGNTATTLDGLDDGVYRVVVRTGDYDPSYLMLTGVHEEYTITKGADGYFTVDISASPTKSAAVIVLDGDQTRLNSCVSSKWDKTCEANSAYRRYILASLVMAPTAEQREILRGTWISTNASTFNLGTVNVATGDFGVSAAGPHYLPTDFGEPGYSTEEGRQTNPAFFKMFIPYETIADILKKVMGVTVSIATVKAFLSSPSSLLQGTIQEKFGTGVLEKVQTLSIGAEDTGIVVDFNLTHFSAPNPKLKLLDPTRKRTSMGNGAVINPLRKATRLKTYTPTSLLKPASYVAVSKIESLSKTVCTVSSTKSVKMLKRGTCKLKVTTSKSRRSSYTTVLVSVI